MTTPPNTLSKTKTPSSNRQVLLQRLGIFCAMMAILSLSITTSCEKKRRRSRRSSSRTDNAQAQINTDPTARSQDLLLRITPLTSGITLAVQCSTPGTLSILDSSDKVLAETTASIVTCDLPKGASSEAKVRFEPADGTPKTQRLILLPVGESLVMRRLIAPTQGKNWLLETVKEKSGPDKIASHQPNATAKPAIPQNPPTSSLDDWVATQPWFKKLVSQMPKGVTLTVNVSPATDPGWSNIHIRERRAPDSGFDPNVSPLVGTFRIAPDRNTLKWLNPLSGDWASLSDFYKYRNIEPEPTVAPAPQKLAANKTADNLLFTKTRDAYYAKTIPAAEAFTTFMMLAKRGNIDAAYGVGILYYIGDGTQQDLAQAHRWFTLAAEKGNHKAMFRLGYMYSHGKGVTQNTAKAMEYYLPAARAGHKAAAHNLGYAYAIGQGVKMDKKQARKWYLTAAKLGNVDSMGNLGRLYYRGEGGKQNRQLGHQWLLCSATRGSALAAAALGSIYSAGKAVKNDPYLACQWWAVAVRGGYTKSAEDIKTTAKKMGWTNHEPRNFPLPKKMVEAKKGTLPPFPE